MQVDRSLVEGFELFEGLAPNEIDDVLSRATSLRYPTGEIVFEQGGAADHFFLLLHGRLRATQVTPEGQQVVVRVVNPGDIFGIARALRRTDYPATVTAAMSALNSICRDRAELVKLMSLNSSSRDFRRHQIRPWKISPKAALRGSPPRILPTRSSKKSRP